VHRGEEDNFVCNSNLIYDIMRYKSIFKKSLTKNSGRISKLKEEKD